MPSWHCRRTSGRPSASASACASAVLPVPGSPSQNSGPAHAQRQEGGRREPRVGEVAGAVQGLRQVVRTGRCAYSRSPHQHPAGVIRQPPDGPLHEDAASRVLRFGCSERPCTAVRPGTDWICDTPPEQAFRGDHVGPGAGVVHHGGSRNGVGGVTALATGRLERRTVLRTVRTRLPTTRRTGVCGCLTPPRSPRQTPVQRPRVTRNESGGPDGREDVRPRVLGTRGR